MASAKYDVVVAGAGHNGLIAAAYLTKAGLNVCVVEIRDKVGGALVTRELTIPGFKHDQGNIVHNILQLNPLIANDELGLKSKYGLKYITCDPSLSTIFPDQRALILYRDMDKTCQSIAQFSQKDAETYPKFCESTKLLMKTASLSMFSPPPPFGRLISFLEAGDVGRETLRVIMSSVMDIANEWFESEQMRATICRYAAEAMMSPWEKGTGWRVLAFPLIQQNGIIFPEGGSGRLSELLESYLKDNGATIRLSSPIKSIKVENGEARGVVLEDGEEILASKAVVSCLNIKQLFLHMVKPEVLPIGFQDRVRHLEPDGFSNMLECLALNEAPKYKAGGDVDKTIWVNTCPTVEDLADNFHKISRGVPVTNMPLSFATSVKDPTRAPKGKHTLWLFHYAPYHLKDGGADHWDVIKNKVADDILDTLRQYTTNMGPGNILGRYVCSPRDFERWNPSLLEGSVHHIGHHLSEWMPNRPLSGWTQYRTPVKRLYQGGVDTHPAGGASGSGRTAAQAIMEDLKIDFKKLIAK